MDNASAVTNNTAAGQFEIRTAAGTSLLKYVPTGDRLDLVHTEVPVADQGKGLGDALVKAALEHARAEQLLVVPSCPFVHAYLRKHPEFKDLVAAS